MKKNLTLIILTFFLAHTYASSVDKNTALLVAKNFYQQMTGTTPNPTLSYTSLNTDESNGLSLGTPLYYAFNMDNNAGFVLVSAEDRCKPIIAYDTKGQFNMQGTPEVITSWLYKYSQEVAYNKVNVTATSPAITSQWSKYERTAVHTSKQLRSGVGPLLNTTWDQTQYYNDACPSDATAPTGFAGRVPTGCGATAMSQIMRYWSYPAQGTGTHTYNSNYGSLSANFVGTTYHWTNMPNSVTSPNTDVATIMYDCGVAVDMTYTYNESLSYMVAGGGVPASCQQAYTTYFGYDPATIQGLIRSNFSSTDWVNMINTEMASSRPVQYAGSGSSGGHTFVLDGSDGSGMYHINWGWSGTDNGYYSVDALTPAPYANGNFSSGESMIIGIHPLNVNVVTSGIQLYQATTVTPTPISFATTFTVNAAALNNGTGSFNGSVCAALFDLNGTFIRYIGNIISTNGTPLASGYYANLSFSDTTHSITVPGTYTVGIYYQPTGTTTWSLVAPAAYTNPIQVTVSAPTDDIALYSDIIATPSTFVQGQGASVNVNLSNNGTSTYYGQYEAVLLDLQGNFVESIGNTIPETAGLPANYSYNSPYLTFTTSNVTSAEGQYILAIAEKATTNTGSWYYCDGTNYKNPVLIDVVNTTISVLAVNDISVEHFSIHPNPATNMFNIVSDGQPLTVSVYDISGQQVINKQMTGAKNTIDVSQLSKGMYIVKVQQGEKNASQKLIVN